jgi:AcrR family transcriptional regulator
MTLVDAPPAPKTRRTQEERRTTSERALASAAVEIMKQKGVAGLTLAEVAAAAGVSKGLVVHLYGNKQGLQLAALNHMRNAFTKRFHAEERNAKGLTLIRDYMRNILDSIGSQNSNARVFSALLSEAIYQDKTFAQAVAAMNSSTIQFVRGCLEFEREQGRRFIDENLDNLATYIVASLRGIAQVNAIHMAASDGLPIDVEALLQLAEDLLDKMVIKTGRRKR